MSKFRRSGRVSSFLLSRQKAGLSDRPAFCRLFYTFPENPSFSLKRHNLFRGDSLFRFDGLGYSPHPSGLRPATFPPGGRLGVPHYFLPALVQRTLNKGHGAACGAGAGSGILEENASREMTPWDPPPSTMPFGPLPPKAPCGCTCPATRGPPCPPPRSPPGGHRLHRAAPHRRPVLRGRAHQEAEALWRDALHMGECLFLTGGSTQGMLTALTLTCRPGDAVLLDRGCHRSVYNALALLDLHPVFLPRPWLAEAGVTGPVSPQDVENLLNSHPEIKTVCITSPTYYGVLSDFARSGQPDSPQRWKAGGGRGPRRPTCPSWGTGAWRK